MMQLIWTTFMKGMLRTSRKARFFTAITVPSATRSLSLTRRGMRKRPSLQTPSRFTFAVMHTVPETVNAGMHTAMLATLRSLITVAKVQARRGAGRARKDRLAGSYYSTSNGLSRLKRRRNGKAMVCLFFTPSWGCCWLV